MVVGKNGMIWLEMINIRTAGNIEAERVFAICREYLQSIVLDNLSKLTVLRNSRYATDISIHLRWKSDPGHPSVLGNEVMSALGSLGLISHTIWIEQE